MQFHTHKKVNIFIINHSLVTIIYPTSSIYIIKTKQKTYDYMFYVHVFHRFSLFILTKFYIFVVFLVEMRGIEPLSKHNPSKASTVYLIELI